MKDPDDWQSVVEAQNDSEINPGSALDSSGELKSSGEEELSGPDSPLSESLVSGDKKVVPSEGSNIVNDPETGAVIGHVIKRSKSVFSSSSGNNTGVKDPEDGQSADEARNDSKSDSGRSSDELDSSGEEELSEYTTGDVIKGFRLGSSNSSDNSTGSSTGLKPSQGNETDTAVVSPPGDKAPNDTKVVPPEGNDIVNDQGRNHTQEEDKDTERSGKTEGVEGNEIPSENPGEPDSRSHIKKKVEEMEKSSKGQHEPTKKVITTLVEIISEVYVFNFGYFSG